MAFNLYHQTVSEFVARLRVKYKSSTKTECAYIAGWILRHITNGDFTDFQVRNAFSLTAGQWTTLKAKMQTMVDTYDAMQLAKGE